VRLHVKTLAGWFGGCLLAAGGCGDAGSQAPAEDVATADMLEDATAQADIGTDGDVPEDTGVSDASDTLADVMPDVAEDGAGDDAVPTDVAADVPADVAIDATDDVASDTTPEGPWRSRLYPEDWTPVTTGEDGLFLHDFSYAGYRNGDAPLPDVSTLPSVDIMDQGAVADGSADTAPALRAAITAAGASAEAPVVIRFPAGLFRFDQRVVIQQSGIIIAGAGADVTRFHFTDAASTSFEGSLVFRGRGTWGADLPLVADGVARGRTVDIADASSLTVGAEVAIGWNITPAFITEHLMAGVWKAFNGTWQPMFRRRVVAIDTSTTPHRVTLDVPLRYPALMRDGASLRAETALLSECGLAHVGLANAVAWNDAWARDQVHVVAFEWVADCFAVGLKSFVSPSAPATGPGSGAHLQSSGLLVLHGRRVTVADSELGPTQHRGPGGNGYLFEVRQSNEVLFRDLVARGGRHNFIQNWGFGVTGVVWLRTRSLDGRAYPSRDSTLYGTGFSEFHHSLATANLIDASWSNDGWSASNRRTESTGAGHTATENVFWNTSGPGLIRSYQFGVGYVIGTGSDSELAVVPPELDPELAPFINPLSPWYLSEPWDFVEGEGRGAMLEPASLYEDQLLRRHQREGR
jgi:hypothetical protein